MEGKHIPACISECSSGVDGGCSVSMVVNPKPQSPRCGVADVSAASVQLHVTADSIDRAAAREVVNLLKQILCVKKRDIEIEGQIVKVNGVGGKQAYRRLLLALL